MPVVSIDSPLTETGLSERQSRILEIVQGRGFATIEQLSAVFAVSAQTIRREVIRLDAARLLQRFHGGAGIAGAGIAEAGVAGAGIAGDSVRLGYRHKQEAAIGSKARVGRAVASLVPDGASIYLDVGTTVEAVATALVGRPLGTVWTNSMSAAAILGQSRQAEIYVTGGLVRGADGSLVGDAATKALAPIAVDFAVIGCSGFASDGSPSDFDPQKVAIKQAAIDNARTTIVAVDSSKFERMAVMRIAPLTSFQILVSDREPHQALGRQLRAGCVEVRIAA